MVCIDARRAHGALSVHWTKAITMMLDGWTDWCGLAGGEDEVKSEESQRIRAILVARSRLVGIRRDIENQVRSLIKEYR